MAGIVGLVSVDIRTLPGLRHRLYHLAIRVACQFFSP